MDGEWDVQPGEVMTRGEQRRRFGGSPQGGIVPSRTSPNIFIYSDPAQAPRYGYNFDGWTDDGSLYLYTGAGTVGDQSLDAVNGSVLTHRVSGRALRLFVAQERQQRGGKLHRYVGEFEVDPETPFYRADAPDEAGELRSVVVFRLLPVGHADARQEDSSDAEPGSPEARVVPVEGHRSETFETAAVVGRTALRRESDLVKRLESWLRAQGHEVARWAIRPAGELRMLWTDTYDMTAKELYEAKGSANRWAIRLAIGQLLDYRRYVLVPDVGLVVAVPSRPSDDLINLLYECGIACVYPDGRAFDRLEPPTLPPSSS
ncbi:MAG: restriction endonuclease [Streptosporangiales bacterium]|nr:restriction endonuclease [Streptosporangiales bacterium]